MTMFIHFCCLRPQGLATKLNFNVSKVVYCLDISCAKMFADDTNITVPGCTFAELEEATNSERTNLNKWLKASKLSLNIAKTEFMVLVLVRNSLQKIVGLSMPNH